MLNFKKTPWTPGKREQIGGYEGWEVGSWVKVVKGYKLPIFKWVISGTVMHNVITIANNTLLYIWKLLKEQILKVDSTWKNIVTIWMMDIN